MVQLREFSFTYKHIYDELPISFIHSTGQVLSLIPAFWMRYYGVALFNSIFPAIFLVAVVFVMPESPTFLALKGSRKPFTSVVIVEILLNCVENIAKLQEKITILYFDFKIF